MVSVHFVLLIPQSDSEELCMSSDDIRCRTISLADDSDSIVLHFADHTDL